MGGYSYSGGAQFLTVNAAGTYDITAYGAQGGSANGLAGGVGAEIGGNFNLQSGERLELFVGQAGGSGHYAGGGGGGTFVLADVDSTGTLTPGSYTLLLAAGGGGGSSGLGAGAAASLAPGDGSGGNAGRYGGGGGAGYKGAGGTYTSALTGQTYGGGGSNRNGAPAYAGGGSNASAGQTGNGGFGGGGGAGYGGGDGGGGGGGYTGGAGGSTDGGGGGGSIDKGATVVAQLATAENRDAQGNGLVTISPGVLCFASGTRLAIAGGTAVVDDLAVGDVVVTVSGARLAVRWLGHRTIDCHTHSHPHEVRPVRIAAHAFGGSRPARDLFLSPGHPVLVGADADGAGGHLVPIMCLINGTTIERVAVDKITYWHVELDEHDILLAEGLPAESYIDLGSRPWFSGADGALYDPDMALPGMPGRCRPVAVDGPIVEAERRRLDGVFAVRLAGACSWPDKEDALAF